jgi:alpha-galactosidase
MKATILFLAAGILLATGACQRAEKDFSIEKNGTIWFRNSRIELKFDSLMYCQVFKSSGVTTITPENRQESPERPSHFIVIDGEELRDFSVDYESIGVESIQTAFGVGRKMVLSGTAVCKDGSSIIKTLEIELYDDYPDVAISFATYTNQGSSQKLIETDYSNHYQMDASLVSPDAEAYDFWSFQGASIAWGMDFITKIDGGFHQENWMGVQPDTKTGGGVPVVDLWNQNFGMAIAHLETKPILVSLPVKVEADQRVSLAVAKQAMYTLAPGKSYQSLKTAVMVHSGDFFDPLSTYSALMANLGQVQEKPSEEAHEAIWCGWGYLTDFSLDDIYGTLPKLKELGIKWVVIDDRWWDKYGDWNIRDFTFPKGEAQIKEFVDSLHNQGFKVKIWWAPTPVQPEKMLSWGGSVDPGSAQIVKDHPEWLIMDEDGAYPRDCRDMYQFCPSVPAVQEYMKELTTRFIGEWGFDGHKLDAYYVVPPCHNPAHQHQRPDESYEDLPKMLQSIYETSKEIKPYSVTEICNCGTNQDFFQSIYTDQPVVSDPTSVEQSRRRVKLIKALWGSDAPAYTDHVEHIRPEADMNDKSDTAKVGQDFASSMGPGGVIGTKFTWPKGPENMQLTGEREEHWQKWFGLYNEKMLSKGTYLNLYDVIYDTPESHVIQKEDVYYYAFYQKEWEGEIELRGLGEGNYKVYDYVNQVDLGSVSGPVGILSASFKKHLLIECSPVK